jgi:hypothetical protein
MTDMEPFDASEAIGPGLWVWFSREEPDPLDPNPSLVPARLVSAMEGENGPSFDTPLDAMIYNTRESAIEALSDAAVQVGRESAGLPILPRSAP